MKDKFTTGLFYILTVCFCFVCFLQFEANAKVRQLKEEKFKLELQIEQDEKFLKADKKYIESLYKQNKLMRDKIYKLTGEVPAYD